MSRRYVIARDKADGTREYWNGRDFVELRQAKRYSHMAVTSGMLELGTDTVLVPLRPKGSLRRESVAQWRHTNGAQAAHIAGLTAERDAARAEVAVVRSERDQMQGRWETARSEVERLGAEIGRKVGEYVAEVERLTKERDAARSEEREACEVICRDRAFSFRAGGMQQAAIAADECAHRIHEYAIRAGQPAAPDPRDARIAELMGELRAHDADWLKQTEAAVANARRAAIEECLRICERFSMYGSSSNCRDAIRALLTTPTADDGKGEAHGDD